MYAYLKGTIESVAEGSVVLDVGGVGYQLYVSSNTLSCVSALGEKCKLFTYLHVKEDEMTLYGFYAEAEKHFFLKLIEVSGIGPKMALNILSGAPLQVLSASIISGDTSTLSSIKGIGKKTAQRIILELKENCSEDDFAINVSGGLSENDQSVIDSLDILEGMGVPRSECYSAVMKAREFTSDVTEIVRSVLVGMNNK